MTSLSENTVVTTSGGLVEVARVTRNTEYTISATSTATAADVFSSHATFVADGSSYYVDFYAPEVYSSTTANSFVYVDLVNSAGTKQTTFGAIAYGDGTRRAYDMVNGRYVITPTAGSVVSLNVRAYQSGGNGAITTGAGNVPATMTVNKIVQASQFIVPLASAPLVTSLPSAPIDGQEIRYVADATNGVIWNLRYDGQGTYPWKFIGGPPIGSLNTGSQSVAANTGTVTASPSLSILLPGDYRIDYGGLTATGTGTGGQYAVIAPAYGGISLGQDHEIGAAGNTSYVTCAASRSFTFATASTLALNHRVDASAGTSFFLRRYINATPIRVKAP